MKLMGVLAVSALAGAGVTWAVLEGRDSGTTEAVQEVQSASAQLPDDGYMGARTKGTPDAPITIFEASDFQCPYCRVFWEETLPALEAEYIATGKASIVFLNFPLTSLHPNAPAAHEFAMCAAAQDQFWATHDLLFEHQEAWATLQQPGSYFRLLLDSLDVSRDEFEECLSSGEVRAVILAEAQAMYRAGLQSTPSFVIEGGLLPGAQPIEVWRPILDSLYEASRR